MNLFESITNEQKIHRKFKFLRDNMIFGEQAIINQWTNGFIDRDNKIVKEFQTTFHSSFWEFYLNSVFHEAGFSIDYSKNRPDFIINSPVPFYVEAVVSNIKQGGDSEENRNFEDLFKNVEPFYLRENFENSLNEAITRYSSSINLKKKKYDNEYSELDYFDDSYPFTIALSGYEQISYGSNFVFPLMALLYGRVYNNEINTYHNQKEIYKPGTDSKIPIGLFLKEEYSEVSAIIFSCTTTLGKLTSLAISNGNLNPNGVITIRQDDEFPTYKIHEVSKETPEYLSDGLFIFHNPLAKNPLPKDLFNKTNAVNITFDISTGGSERRANNLLLVSRLNLVTGKYTLPFMYSEIFEKFNPDIAVVQGVISDIEEYTDSYDVTFTIENEYLKKIITFSLEAFEKYCIEMGDSFQLIFYFPEHQKIMDMIRTQLDIDIKKLKLAFLASDDIEIVDIIKNEHNPSIKG
ncbi:hypothetical protein AB6N28_00595 [Moraxella osloensis]|jgi:hypothetical protein|uniref:hypothetical protein n=1 Tax=Faucicola osloensis TaxID=34062 RepID=UPI0034DFA2FD